MSGYGAREVAKMLGLSLGQVRAYVRAGFLEPTRGPRGELRFSFQDLVLLRTAQGLVSARIAPRRVRSALRKLKERLPERRPPRGRLLHEAGDPRAAAQHYRKAIELRPDSVVALFNLGVALEDLRMPDEAILAYRTALAADAGCADAHYNLAQLYEARGDGPAALRHLRTYRKLVQA